MKHLAFAAVVLALMVCDLLAESWALPSGARRAWGQWNTVGLAGSVLWFWHHRNA